MDEGGACACVCPGGGGADHRDQRAFAQALLSAKYPANALAGIIHLGPQKTLVKLDDPYF